MCKIAALRSFSLERLQYFRERESGMSSLAYFLARDTIDHFSTVVKPIIYLSMFYYFGDGLPPHPLSPPRRPRSPRRRIRPICRCPVALGRSHPQEARSHPAYSPSTASSASHAPAPAAAASTCQPTPGPSLLQARSLCIDCERRARRHLPLLPQIHQQIQSL